MARADTIWRLHHVEAGNLGTVVPNAINERQAREPAPPPERLRGRFRLGTQEPGAGYQLDVAEIMAVVQPAGAMDRSGAFQALVLRQEIQRAREQFIERAQRIAGRSQRDPVFAIQA
jgi:hypothetical protein